MVPAISERVAWTGPVLREDLTLLLASTDRPVKITVPGPLTIADTAVSEAYADPDDLIMDLAAAVNAEAKSLAELGPAMIQIDEPAFNAEPETARRIGIAALDRCLEGVECATAVHICYGYGTESVLRWKNANTSWGQYEQLLPLLAGSRVDVLSLEFAAPKLSPDVLELAGDKCVAFGCIDVSPAPEERPEGIARKLEGALRVITEDRLYPSTDCGMAPLNYELAVRKMHSLGEAVALLRGARDRP
ncbi:MAG: methionine synthase [Chloroflexi bacterium]|nr:methionine synthase [Chloroflexota bacterium]